MDDNQFDQIVRSLTISSPRRAALNGLVGGALAAMLPAVVAQASRRHGEVHGEKKGKGKGKGKGCPKGKKKCGKKCIPKGNCCSYFDCTGCRNERCINGKCQCEPGLIMHNGKCGFFIDCQSYGETCTSSIDCCGNVCSDDGSGVKRCLGKSIHDCIVDSDCKSGPCIGFLCPEANEPYFDLCR